MRLKFVITVLCIIVVGIFYISYINNLSENEYISKIFKTNNKIYEYLSDNKKQISKVINNINDLNTKEKNICGNRPNIKWIEGEKKTYNLEIINHYFFDISGIKKINDNSNLSDSLNSKLISNLNIHVVNITEDNINVIFQLF